MTAAFVLAALIGALAPEACPTPINDIVTSMEAQGATFEGLYDSAGPGFDQVLEFSDQRGKIVVGLALRGCVISDPVALQPERLKDKGA